MPVVEFDGHIMGASFESGDRFVAGRWFRSPFGAFADVMWCRPNGRRVLLAPDARVLEFVGRHYAFDELLLEPVRVERTASGSVLVTSSRLRLELRPRAPGVTSWLLAMRPRRARTSRTWIGLEDRLLRPIVRPLFRATDVRTTGVTAAGAREWYAIHDHRAADATASIDGVALGRPAPCPPAGFGFSEFPSTPAIVRVTSFIDSAADRRPGSGVG